MTRDLTPIEIRKMQNKIVRLTFFGLHNLPCVNLASPKLWLEVGNTS